MAPKTLCVVALAMCLGLATSRYVDNHVVSTDETTMMDNEELEFDDAINKAETSDSSSSYAHAVTKYELVLLCPFMILTGGVIVKVALAKVPLPYTAILLLLGLGLGMGLRRYDDKDWTDSLAKSAAQMSGMDAHLLLFLFLPPLLFESASQMEWHLCWSSKSYILMLAGPGVLCATYFTGFFLNTIIRNIGYEPDLHKNNCEKGWKDIDGYLLGVILSATDPVAVVALLAELGAKKSLATNIEGESLLNDGTAYVLFIILFKFAEGEYDTEPEMEDHLLFFVKMAIGGGAFGYLMGNTMLVTLNLIINDSIAEITVTVVFAWMTFFIAEFYFGISGVLAVVALGLHFGYVGKNNVSAQVWHTMEEFWEMMTFFANTLVFVVAGMIIGHKSQSPDGAAIVHLLLSYLSITVVRSCVTWSVYFFLRYLGKELDWRDQVVGIWGGLRGAVGLALAMIVSHSHKMCEDTTNKVLYHTAGIVLLTVCFNAPTLPYIMKALKMTSVSKSKKIVFKNSIDVIKEAAVAKEEDLKLNPMFDQVDWKQVDQFHVEAPPGYDLDEDEELQNKGWDDVEARMRILMVCKECYTRAQREGQLSTSAALKLKHITDTMLDQEGCPLGEWELVEKYVGQDQPVELLVEPIEEGNPGYKQQEVLKVLDHPAFVVFILFVVFAATVCSFALPDVKELDYIFCAIFLVEVSIRCWAIGTKDGLAAIKADHFTMMDISLTSLDIVLIAMGDLVGNANDFARLFRFFRFLRLARLLRLARFAKMAKTKAVKKKQEILQNKSVLFDEEREAKTIGQYLKKAYAAAKKYMVMKQVEKEYQAVMGFLDAREEAHEMLETMLDSMSNGGHNPVLDIIHEDMHKATHVLRGYQGTYPELAGKVTSKMAAHMIINSQSIIIDELAHHGMLEGTECEKMIESVNLKLARLKYNPPTIPIKNKENMIENITSGLYLTGDLDSDFRSKLNDEMHAESMILQEEGMQLDDWVYFVGRGVVTVSQTINGELCELEELSSGELLPPLKLLGMDKSDIEIKTTGASYLFKILLKDVQKMMDGDGKAVSASKYFTLQMWYQIAMSMCHMKKRAKEWANKNNMLLKDIRAYLQNYRLFVIHKDDTVKMAVDEDSRDKTQVFFSGKGSITYNGTTYSKMDFIEIEQGSLEFKVTADTIFLANKDLLTSHKPWDPNPESEEEPKGVLIKQDSMAAAMRSKMPKSPKPTAYISPRLNGLGL